MFKLFLYPTLVVIVLLLTGYSRLQQTCNDFVLESTMTIPEFEDISGVTYNASTGKYWLVNNKPAFLFEIDEQGSILRRIKFDGIYDSEDVVWVKSNVFAVVDEGTNTFYLFDVKPEDKVLTPSMAIASWKAPGEVHSNKGLESVAFDRKTQKFYCATEKEPIRLFEVQLKDGKAVGREIETDIESKIEDLSAMTLHDDQHLYLSDEENLLIFHENSVETSRMSLSFGYNGLSSSLEQAEGVTFAKEKLVICSEPNQVYFFKRRDR